jgi:glucokinase
MSDLFIGVDLGGTNIKAGLVDREGALVNKVSIPTEANLGRERILENICAAARQAAGDTPLGDIDAVGIGSPGPLDHVTGVVFRSPNLKDWTNVPLAEEVTKRLGVTTFVDNDANVACWGEYWVGAGKGCSTVVLMTLGTGIGGGIILDNRIWRGSTGAGAEIGHMVVVADGEKCGCGGIGCLEVYASAPATVRRFVRMISGGRDSSLASAVAEGGEITASMIYEAACAGDETAKEALEETGRYLGVGVTTIANVIDPEAVLFSGGLAGAADILLPVIRAEVRKRALEPVTENLTIALGALPNDAGVIGAAGCAMDRLGSDG